MRFTTAGDIMCVRPSIRQAASKRNWEVMSHDCEDTFLFFTTEPFRLLNISWRPFSHPLTQLIAVGKKDKSQAEEFASIACTVHTVLSYPDTVWWMEFIILLMVRIAI